MDFVGEIKRKLRFDPWKLRVARDARGFTTQDLAEAMGLSASSKVSVTEWETYKKRVGEVTMQRLCFALKCEPADLSSDFEKYEANKLLHERFSRSGLRSVGEFLQREGLL